MKWLVSVAVLLASLLPSIASAHPLGNFSVNQYNRIEPAGDEVRDGRARASALRKGARADRDVELSARVLDRPPRRLGANQREDRRHGRRVA